MRSVRQLVAYPHLLTTVSYPTVVAILFRACVNRVGTSSGALSTAGPNLGADGTSATHDVTITQPGTMGVIWKQMTIGTGANRCYYPMVKSVQAGSVGDTAGLQPFEVLSVLNGRPVDSATTPYEQVISLLRSTRPLHLSFRAEKAALRSTVTFVRPGPLGLQLEPVTGNPVRPSYFGHLCHGRLLLLLLAAS